MGSRERRVTRRRLMLASLLLAGVGRAVGGRGAVPPRADPASDEPEGPRPLLRSTEPLATYRDALQRWRSAEEVNAWIGAHFEYDRERALRLSDTQRRANGGLPIHAPEAFFAAPRGVCVDLARFAVETLQRIDPSAAAAYLMIEFDPQEIEGQILRRHWIALFTRDGRRHYFADSKRPGLLSGPYASSAAFVADYERYRGRRIVSFQERASTRRTLRRRAPKSIAESAG